MKKDKLLFASAFLLSLTAANQAQTVRTTPQPTPKTIVVNVPPTKAAPPEKSSTVVTETAPERSPMLAAAPEPTLEEMLSKAEEQTRFYLETFKNLVADETKTFVEYDKKGSEKNRTTIVSNFIVYQPQQSSDVVTEYRNVIKVNNKKVEDNEQRAQDFFEKVLKANTVQQELDKIRRESSRYDKTIDISDLTLYQSPVLAANVRPAFEFRLNRKEMTANGEVYVVEYRQIKDSPYITFTDEDDDRATPTAERLKTNSFELDLPEEVDRPNARLKGVLWLDAVNFQILREERTITIQPDDSPTIYTAMEMLFEYAKTDLPISAPKHITLTDYNIRATKDDELIVRKNAFVTFDYTKFSAPNVSVEKGEVEEKNGKP